MSSGEILWGLCYCFTLHVLKHTKQYERSQRYVFVHWCIGRHITFLIGLGLIPRVLLGTGFQIRCSHTVSLHFCSSCKVQIYPRSTTQSKMNPNQLSVLEMANRHMLRDLEIGQKFHRSDCSTPFQLRSENQARVLVIQSEETLSVPQIEIYSELCISAVQIYRISEFWAKEQEKNASWTAKR